MKTHKNLNGLRFFRDVDDHIEMIRIYYAGNTQNDPLPTHVYVIDEATKEKSKIAIDELKDWTPLEPDGYITFNIVTVKTTNGEQKDVIVTIQSIPMIKYAHDIKPFAICRQSITDIFANLICVTEEPDIVGLAVNQSNCPANFDYMMMLACNEIIKSDHFNIYRSDTLERDILPMMADNTIAEYDLALDKLFLDAIKESPNAPILEMSKNSYKGWTRSLSQLLKENNFQSDIDEMFGITKVMFDIDPYLEKKVLPTNKDVEYDAPCDDLRLWLSSVFKVNIKDATVLKYNHDINLGDFNNSTYFFIRDSKDQLYFVVYNAEGEYLEADLEAKRQEHDFSTNFRIEFYNKYNRNNNDIRE